MKQETYKVDENLTIRVIPTVYPKPSPIEPIGKIIYGKKFSEIYPTQKSVTWLGEGPAPLTAVSGETREEKGEPKEPKAW